MSGLYRRLTEPPSQPVSKLLSAPSAGGYGSGLYTPPRRTGSPFQPPPLTPLTLKHTHLSSNPLLSRSLAEEIRLLIPSRLQLVDDWTLVYSLDRDGASLTTLYQCCQDFSRRSQRAGYVLVVRDGSPQNGAIFGAYMTDPPKPSAHYYGTGECFLWRASILSALPVLPVSQPTHNGPPPSEDLLDLAGLPPPPSADTTNLQRFTTVRGEKKSRHGDLLDPLSDNDGRASGASTPDRIRFKAFPYSGVNDFMLFCETGFLSVGGGDGHYGLWLDDSLDKGISEACPTFGNEPLSDEGKKFDIMGVEIWYVGA
ncbi:MAG: hypothetical protein Q9227_001896 [Pyrenula ochraceoflavens]